MNTPDCTDLGGLFGFETLLAVGRRNRLLPLTSLGVQTAHTIGYEEIKFASGQTRNDALKLEKPNEKSECVRKSNLPWGRLIPTRENLPVGRLVVTFSQKYSNS
jgi:hypothetical protein